MPAKVLLLTAQPREHSDAGKGNTSLLDAHSFGVPQHRRRLFVICDSQREPAMPRPYRKAGATAASVLRPRDGEGTPWPFRPLDSGRRATATLERARRAIQELGDREAFLLVYYGSDGAGGWQLLDRPSSALR